MPFELAGKERTSRLILGTGGFPSLELLREAIEASGTELVTVALRRIDPGMRGSLVDVLLVHRRLVVGDAVQRLPDPAPLLREPVELGSGRRLDAGQDLGRRGPSQPGQRG